MKALSFHLQAFDGPLDLLLHLISKNKVNICDIPIAEILKQYMECMNDAQSNDIEIKSEFVEMAAQLVLIKSKMLLPNDKYEQQEDPRAGLVQMLLEYQRIKSVSQYFVEQSEIGQNIFIKQTEILQNIDESSAIINYQIVDLMKAVQSIKERMGRRMPPSVMAFSGIVGKEKASVADKINLILELLYASHKITFIQIFGYAQSRSEIVATFLAMLELIKDKQISMVETNNDYDIMLYE